MASLAGRTSEVAAVEQAIEAVASGQVRVVLVTGEPGIGKSRLLTEASARADATGFRVLSGYAAEGPWQQPLAPLRMAFASIAPSADAAGAIDITEVAGAPRPPAEQRAHLADAVTRLLRRLTQERPVALVLDDVQWADAATWDLLGYVVVALRGERLLVILSARDGFLDDLASPAVGAVHGFNRDRVLTMLPLSPLAPDALAGLVEDEVRASPTERFVAALARQSEGNPFFAEELLRHLLERGAVRVSDGKADGSEEILDATTLPTTVRLAVGQRLGRLPEDAIETLRTAALVGVEWGAAVVAAALGWPVPRVRQAVAPALENRLLAEGSEGFRFAHHLIRETLLQERDPKRVERHAAVAAALEATVGGDELARTAAAAEHWERAGRTLETACAALQASRLAMQRHAWDLARGQAALAVAAAEALGSPQADLRLEAGMLLSQAAMSAGAFALAEATLRSLIPLAEGLGRRAEAAQARALLAEALQRQERPEEAAAAFTVALEQLREQPGLEPETVRTLAAAAALAGVTRHRYEEAEALASEALALAEGRDAPALTASALLVLATVRTLAGRPSEARPQLEAALEQALVAEDAGLVAQAEAALANSYAFSGEIRASQRAAERRLEAAQAAGDVFGLRHAHSWLALLAFGRGEWERATALLDEAEPLLEVLDSPEPLAFVRFVRGGLAYRQGRLAEAEKTYAQALEGFARGDPTTTVWYGAERVLVALDDGREADARRLMARLEDDLRLVPRTSLPALHAWNRLALAYAQLLEVERGAEAERLLRPHAGMYFAGSVSRSLAALAVLRGETREAVAHLVDAEQQARREDMLPDLAYALTDRTRLLEPRDPSRAAALEEARQIVEGLPMPLLAARVESLTSQSPRPGGLTPREVEVLALVVSGQTNTQIGEALVISEHTVANHLAHILDKTGAANRAGAAAWALRNGVGSAELDRP